MRISIILLSAALVLSACANAKVNSGRNVEFDGVKFRAKISKGEEREDFAVLVRGPSKSLVGAREAGRYEGTKYCIKNFGTSEILWANGPDDADEALVIVDDTLAFQGRCKGW
ncbi:MAG: hypothetical protein Q9M48_15475 [Rhodobacterales bacterium]|nr:hypothetical protein [Rhodobacterales bacterium]